MDQAAEAKIALTERQRYWLEHIRACESSGISIAEYCATHDVNPHGMYAGKKKLVEKGVLPRTHAKRFQRAQVIDSSVDNEWRIQLPNGSVVSFTGVVDAQALTTVLTATARLA